MEARRTVKLVEPKWLDRYLLYSALHFLPQTSVRQLLIKSASAFVAIPADINLMGIHQINIDARQCKKDMIILTTISNVCNVCYNKFVQQNLKPFFSMFNTPSGQTPPTEYNYQFVTKKHQKHNNRYCGSIETIKILLLRC